MGNGKSLRIHENNSRLNVNKLSRYIFPRKSNFLTIMRGNILSHKNWKIGHRNCS